MLFYPRDACCTFAENLAPMRFCLFCLLLLSLTSVLRGQPVLVLDEGFEECDLAPFCRVLKILDSTARPGAIAQIDPEQDFAPAPRNGLNFGFELASYWVTFAVENQSEKPGEWHLDIPNPNLSILHLYRKTEGGLLLQTSTGLLAPAPPLGMAYFYHFPIRLAGGERARFYLFANVGRTANNPTMPAQILNERGFLKNIAQQSARQYFFAAVYLIFILIASLMHYALRTKPTFWLLLFVLASVLFLMGLNGTFLEINWTIFRHLSRFFVGGASGFSLIAFTILFIEFYELEQHLPRLAVGMKNLANLFIVVMALQSVRYWVEIPIIAKMTYVLSVFYIVPTLYVFTISGLLFCRKRRHHYLLFAEIYLLSLLNAVFLAGQQAGFLPLQFDAVFFVQIGFSVVAR